jgi:hypothetical protein
VGKLVSLFLVSSVIALGVVIVHVLYGIKYFLAYNNNNLEWKGERRWKAK